MKYANYFPETRSQIVIGTIYNHFHIGYKAVRCTGNEKTVTRGVAECTQKRIYIRMLKKQLDHSGTEIEIFQYENVIPVWLFASITNRHVHDGMTILDKPQVCLPREESPLPAPPYQSCQMKMKYVFMSFIKINYVCQGLNKYGTFSMHFVSYQLRFR